jgi:hypothetical protein
VRDVPLLARTASRTFDGIEHQLTLPLRAAPGLNTVTKSEQYYLLRLPTEAKEN